MPYTTAFPKALGTGLLISTAALFPRSCAAKWSDIDEYEHALSRFRADSLVTRIGNAEHGGHFDFPDWAGPLFDLYDALHAATRGAIDPCVGEDLIRLGYDPTLSFTVEADAGERLGALRGRPVWGRDVVRSDVTTLVTQSGSFGFRRVRQRVIWLICWAVCSPIQNFRAHRIQVSRNDHL